MEKRFKRIYIEITNVCNLKCRFCDTINRKQEFMTIDNVEKILNQIKNYTDYIYLHVKGEPLLHPNIEKILDLAYRYNLNVIITTNGTLIKNKAGILSKAKAIRQINISLHSIEQNSDLDFDKKLYFEDLFNTVEEITKVNNFYVSYRLWNLEDIKNSDKNTEVLNSLKNYYNISNLFELVKNNDFIKISEKKYINLDTIYEWPNLNKDVISKTGSCYGLINQIAILVDGTVVPCCLDQNGDINLGNILESGSKSNVKSGFKSDVINDKSESNLKVDLQSNSNYNYKNNFENILNSNLVKEIEEGFKKNKLLHPLCQRCGFRELKRR